MQTEQTLFPEQTAKQESAWQNLVFNILLPVFLLHQGGKWMNPNLALVLAIAFPLGYGVRDYIVRKKLNALSALGLLNVGITGGLALLKLDGMWFAVKEAAFPTIVGAFVLGSAFTARPFIRTLLFQPQVFRLQELELELRAKQKVQEFLALMRTATIALSGSFFLSAFLNLALALRIFTPIDQGLGESDRAQVLNEQLAKMTSSSFLVIMLPSILCLMLILWFLLHRLAKITERPMSHFMHQE